MKKNEAISILATSLRPREPKDRARYDEAVKMAIDALNCSEIPNNSDTISKQAVTKFLNDWLSCLFENCHKQSASDLKMIIKDFKNLPSAQPERKTGRWITDDSELGIKCNKCGKSFSDYVNAGTGYIFLEEIPNFCPNCGEDIRGEG